MVNVTPVSGSSDPIIIKGSSVDGAPQCPKNEEDGSYNLSLVHQLSKLTM